TRATRSTAEQEEPHLAGLDPRGELVDRQNRVAAQETTQRHYRLAGRQDDRRGAVGVRRRDKVPLAGSLRLQVGHQAGDVPGGAESRRLTAKPAAEPPCTTPREITIAAEAAAATKAT